MIKLPAVLGFTALTFFSWGTYGVLLHHGQLGMERAFLKPFIFVGVAYFFIAVLFPGIVLSRKNEKGSWSFMGSILSFFAGAVGALGALGIILALNFGGSPIYVMPFVFGIAPVVNTLVTASINKTFNQIKVPFLIGLALVILGATGVLISKGLTKPKAETHATTHYVQPSDTTRLVAFQTEPTETKVEVNVQEAASQTPAAKPETKPNFVGIIFSMVMAAFCWGAYGPVLHIGQMKMGGSRLRPFICVGLAYFFIAVALPLILIQMDIDRGSWSVSGAAWSIAAGALGAIGALGIIYAFNFGGKPIFVMPLVFGFAPIINTVVSMSESGTLSQISPLFIGALATTIAGAVMVLVFQPSGKGHGKPPASPATTKSEPSQPSTKSDATSAANSSSANSVPSTSVDVMASSASPAGTTSTTTSDKTAGKSTPPDHSGGQSGL